MSSAWHYATGGIMVKIALCDDDIKIAHLIESDIHEMKLKDCSLDIFYDGKCLMDYLMSNDESYNIYLMDIEMPGLNGIDTAAAIRQRDSQAIIIFITDHQEFVYEVFEVLPFRFLRKPVAAEEISRALAAALLHITSSGQLFFFHIGHEKHQLPYHEILYFEGFGRKVRIHTRHGQKMEIYGKISDIGKDLATDLFAQMHASFIVNLEQVRAIRQAELVLAGDIVLPVSQKYRKSIKEQHLAFVERRCVR